MQDYLVYEEDSAVGPSASGQGYDSFPDILLAMKFETQEV